MGQLLRDAWAYLRDVGVAYQVMVGGAGLWVVYNLALKTPLIPSTWKTKTEKVKQFVDVAVFFLLLLAPFNVWREQRAELASTRERLTAAVSRADSLQAVIPRVKEQLTTKAEKASAERRTRIVAGLRRLLVAADSLDVDVAMIPSPDTEARWTERCRRFLQTCGLDETYLARFDAAARPGDDHRSSGSGASFAFQKHKAVLVEFLAKLSGPP